MSDVSGEPEKQFLVMPIAKDGDLSGPGRLRLYAGSVDAVLQVAKQLTAGLAAAHAAGVVHRDIKPQNILFTGMGHEIWISDFGICLLRSASHLRTPGSVSLFQCPTMHSNLHSPAPLRTSVKYGR
ncbi:MAG: protein kinase [Syntrophorhabdales bacterium]